jgi:methionyl-tRNA formyltransferase
MPPSPPWRVVLFSMHPRAALGLDALVRAAGHETVALLAPRLRDGATDDAVERWVQLVRDAPPHLDVCVVPEKLRLARLLEAYEPDLGVCIGYPWLLPPEVLAIPRLGIVNGHPSLLPRWRGPFPIPWAVREGDAELGTTFHLMDGSFDTGPILAQGSVPMPLDYEWSSVESCLAELTQNLLPPALDRLARGEPGDPQDQEGGRYASAFPSDFVELDLEQPAAVVHRHVASWRFVFRYDGLRGALTLLDGVRTRILRTSLVDPGDGARVLRCADGPLWVLEYEPAG